MKSLLQIWQFLWAWYNLPFSISILFFLGLSGLQFVGLGQEHEADQDLELDQDLDLEQDLDINPELDLDQEKLGLETEEASETDSD